MFPESQKMNLIVISLTGKLENPKLIKKNYVVK